MTNLILDQRIRSRKQDIAFNQRSIEKFETELKRTDLAPIHRDRITQRMEALRRDNESMAQKNRNFRW